MSEDKRFRVKNSINIKPNSSTPNIQEAGDLRVDSSDSNLLKYHDGSTEDVVVRRDATETLTNKSINAPDNDITNLTLGNLDPTTYKTTNTANTLVYRGASGQFSAGAVTVDSLTAVTDGDPIGAIAGTFTGDLTGNVTGNVTGNATTATTALGISAANLPSAIDAAKIANGSVSNTEFQYLDGVSSSIQTQINSKISSGAAAIVNADVSASAAIDASKIGNGSVSNTEFGYLDGVTSAIQTQIGTKITSGAGAIVNADVSASAAIDASKIGNGSVSNTEFGYLDGVTSAIQTQIGTKITSGAAAIVNADVSSSAAIDASKIGNGSVSNTEFGYLDGVTSAIQTQIGTKITSGAAAIVNADVSSTAAIDASKIANGSVSNTEFQYLDGVTSAIQTQLNTKLSGTVAIANGGTGQTTAALAFNALSPNTTLGDITYGDGANSNTRLAGNTSATKKYLAQTGNAVTSAAPVWSQPAFSELTGSCNLSTQAFGTLPIANGGTGQTTAQLAIDALLPAQGSANGQYLTSNGTTSSWAAVTASPTLTYVGQSSTLNPAAMGRYYSLSGASFTITLPTAASISGQYVTFKHNGTSFSQVYTLNTTSSQTIGGIASGSYKLVTAGESLTVVSDGSNWQIMSHFTDTGWVDGGNITYSAITTPPTQSGNTKTVDKFWWRRQGDTLVGRLEWKQTASGSNTGGSGNYLLKIIPASTTIDTNKVTVYTTADNDQRTNMVGTGQIGNGTTTWSAGMVVYDNTYVRIGNNTGGLFHGSSNFAITTATLAYNFHYSLPMTDWQP